MARFYFDVQEGEQFTADAVGTELAGPQVIFAEARRLLLDIARDLISEAEPFLIEVSVREAEGGPVHWHSLLMEARWAGSLNS